MESPLSLTSHVNDKGSAVMNVDYLSAGNVLGEIGLLTRHERHVTIWCETTVQVSVQSTIIPCTRFEP